MARPTKQGIDYFPLDVQFDEKVELFIAERGADGLGILLTIWQMTYQNEGYYIRAGDDLCLLVRRRVMADIETVRGTVLSAVERGVFDYDMYERYEILTSKAIQKRFFDAAKKKKTVNVVKNYIMSGVSVSENSVYSSGNAANVKEDVKEKEDVKVDGDEKGDGKKSLSSQSEKPKKQDVLDYSKWPEMPSDQVMDEWKALRKTMKAKINQTVINRYAKQLHLAAERGFTVDDCISECVYRGWRGFEADWMKGSGGVDESYVQSVWAAYSNAYFFRYGTNPLYSSENIKVIKQFCEVIPRGEADGVAGFYVSHNDQWYVKQLHPLSLMLKDYQKLRTEWATNRQVTSGMARQLDDSQTNAGAVAEAIRIMNEREGLSNGEQ